MPRLDLVRESIVKRTPRVMQMEGIFAVPPSERTSEQWSVDFNLPDVWNVGVIVGPSGSGKTTIARALWPNELMQPFTWDESKSILDGFPASMSIKDIIELLSSVGFSSPPSWVRPFHVLSNGEQFRVNMARVLAEQPDLAVVDEFTSVVDRTVAQIGSAAIQKTVRRRRQKFIAVTCHYDVLEWLEPDWIYQPHTNELQVGRSLHRPKIELEIKRVHRSAWKLFGKFHYLDNELNSASHCYCAFWRGVPVAFCAVLAFPHPRSPGWRFHRLVCLPDFQGVGIGSALADYVGSLFKSTGKPVRRTLAHPAVIHACMRSPVWKTIMRPQMTSSGGKTGVLTKPGAHASNRLVASFEYIGPALPKDEAQRIMGNE